jgi:short chain dehydrogenase
MLLEKNAIVYGAGGAIGGAVAREFAREGARVFLAGRTRASLDPVAADIAADGASARVDVLDALDGPAVDAHVRSVVERAGSLDVSISLVTRGDVQGIPAGGPNGRKQPRPRWIAAGPPTRRCGRSTALSARRHPRRQRRHHDPPG